MTRRTDILARFALGLTLSAGLAASASAQSVPRTRANIPFAFSANKQPMAPGTYSVEITQSHIISMRNLNTGKTEMLMVRPDQFTPNNGDSRLVFHREAGQIYLTQVWIQGRDLHSNLISHPRPNREFAKLSPPDSTFEIAAE
jgi:hypothetical protein